jgi:hypothetical protein
MTDYPRFECINESPDIAHQRYYGAPLVDFVFRLADRWRGTSPRASNTATGSAEIHERPRGTNPEAPASGFPAAAAYGLFKATGDEHFEADFLSGSARTQRLQVALIVALVTVGVAVAVQGVPSAPHSRGQTASLP